MTATLSIPSLSTLAAKAAPQSVLDALTAHVAILDDEGVIVTVNEAWVRFGVANKLPDARFGVGGNYLKLCESASGPCSKEAAGTASGIRSVIAGELNEFRLEYPCHSPTEQRWFVARVTRFLEDGSPRLLVTHHCVTERKLSELALQAGERRMRFALEAGNLGAFEHGMADDLIFVSPEFCRILDFPPCEFISNADWVDRVHPDCRDELMNKLRRLVSEHEALSHEYRLLLPRIGERWIRAMAAPVVVDGKVERIHGVVQDITERKTAESTLRQLSLAVEQSPASIVITDRQGHMQYVNPKFCALSGYTSTELYGRTPRILKSGETTSEAYRKLWSTIKSGNEWHGEFHNRRKDGELYWESAYISPIRGEDGKITNFVAVKEDITERKRTEAALIESEKKFRQLADNISDVFWISSPDLKTLHFVSNGYQRIWGRSLESLYEKPLEWMQSVHPDDHVAVEARFAQLGTAQAEVDVEYRILRPDGSIRWIHDRGFEVRDEAGNLVRLAGIASDITERKRIAQELLSHQENGERSRRALEHEKELNLIKSRFVSLVSHEFRTPLGIVNTAAFLVEKYGDRMAPEERTGHIHEINRAVERMTEMMDQLIIHGKIDAGKITCKPSVVNMPALCSEAMARVHTQTGRSRAIRCEIDPLAEQSFVDEKMFSQILVTLLGNAVKYSAEDQLVSIAIKHIAGNTDACNWLVLTVTDLGIGIPAEELSKVGQPFYRASNVDNRSGVGMGLAVVRQFLILHRGEIQIESEEGKGTSVTVRLPMLSPVKPPNNIVRLPLK